MYIYCSGCTPPPPPPPTHLPPPQADPALSEARFYLQLLTLPGADGPHAVARVTAPLVDALQHLVSVLGALVTPTLPPGLPVPHLLAANDVMAAAVALMRLHVPVYALSVTHVTTHTATMCAVPLRSTEHDSASGAGGSQQPCGSSAGCGAGTRGGGVSAAHQASGTRPVPHCTAPCTVLRLTSPRLVLPSGKPEGQQCTGCALCHHTFYCPPTPHAGPWCACTCRPPMNQVS